MIYPVSYSFPSSTLHFGAVVKTSRHTDGISFINGIRNDPAFLKNNLTPSIATENDLKQVAQLIIDLNEEQGGINKQYQINIKQEKNEIDNLISSDLKRRFINNTKGCLIVLKNQLGTIIGMIGINQFQETHDFQMETGDFQGINKKHGLVNKLYVKPYYRKRGIGTGLKKAIIKYGQDHFEYKYVWSSTQIGSISSKINKKLGYQELTSKTGFLDSSEFTPSKNKSLMMEYNTNRWVLSWLKIPENFN